MEELLNDLYELSCRLPKLVDDLRSLAAAQQQVIENFLVLDDLTKAAIAKSDRRTR